MATAVNRIHATFLAAMVGLVLPRLDLAMESVNGSPGMDQCSIAFVPKRNFSEIGEGLQRTVSNRLNSNTYVGTIHEAHGNYEVEAGKMSVNEKVLDPQTHFRRRKLSKKMPRL